MSWVCPIKFDMMSLISWVLPGLISQENCFEFIFEYNESGVSVLFVFVLLSLRWAVIKLNYLVKFEVSSTSSAVSLFSLHVLNIQTQTTCSEYSICSKLQINVQISASPALMCYFTSSFIAQLIQWDLWHYFLWLNKRAIGRPHPPKIHYGNNIQD